MLRESNILITGGTGSFGHAFVPMTLKKYNPKKRTGDIEGIWVTDYYTLRLIDAKKAFYVVGSDLLGPMGRELIPHINAKAAKNFLKDHEGKKILKFDEVNIDLIESLR